MKKPERLKNSYIFVVGGVICLIGLILGKPTLGLLALNFARLYNLNNYFAPTLYQFAQNALPNNERLRLQTAHEMAVVGQVAQALALLDENLNCGTGQSAAAQRLNDIVQLLAQQQDNAAMIKYYERCASDVGVRLAQSSAANVLNAYFQANKQPQSNDLIALISALVQYDQHSPEFEILRQPLAQQVLWSSSLGERLKMLIAWQSQLQRKITPISNNQINLAEIFDDLNLANTEHANNPLRLGQNLASNGDFEHDTSCNPAGWLTPSQLRGCSVANWTPSYMSTGNPWNTAVFVLGRDVNVAYSGGAAMRIDGILLERQPSRENARAGYWHSPITIGPGELVLVRFVYMTKGVNEPGAGIWLSDDPNVVYAHEFYLPKSEGKWSQVVILGWNRHEGKAKIEPLLRLHAEGTVWYDAFEVYEIKSARPVLPKSPIVIVK
jgi:hypothetical protein